MLESVTREGAFLCLWFLLSSGRGFCVCVFVVGGWFLLSTTVHLLCFREGRVELWLMPRSGEWYNLSNSWQDWNQLSVPTQLLSWGGGKQAAQCSNQEQGISFFLYSHFAQVLWIGAWDIPANCTTFRGRQEEQGCWGRGCNSHSQMSYGITCAERSSLPALLVDSCVYLNSVAS